jgi:pyruvate kinase
MGKKNSRRDHIARRRQDGHVVAKLQENQTFQNMEEVLSCTFNFSST